jgi:polyphosphate kinase
MSKKKPKPELFINRELSWLEFNMRVLHEALNQSNPLLERLKFLSIVSSNLDEFFMVRVGGLKRMRLDGNHRRDPSGLTPTRQLAEIADRVHTMIDQQYECLNNVIIPELRRHSVVRHRPESLAADAMRTAERYFEEEIFPTLTPIAIEEGHFPRVAGLTLHLAVRLRREGDEKKKPGPLAVIPIPRNWPRYFQIPSSEKGFHFVLIEDLVMHFADRFFAGHAIEEVAAFRLTRNADVPLDDEVVSDLVEAMEDVLRDRKAGFPVRLAIEARTSAELTRRLVKAFGIETPAELYRIPGPLDLTTFMSLVSSVDQEELKYPPFEPQPVSILEDAESIFEVLSERDVLVHLPYESFRPVIAMLEEAAEDPRVMAIKQTLYRTSSLSPIIAALERAALSGKQVTVLVELKARFDEAQNIRWAQRLTEAGAHVIYGVTGFKTHAKALMVIRRESGGTRRYVHLSTGNYHDRTARLYEDIGLLTSDPDFGADVSNLFNALTGYSEPRDWRDLVVAPTILRERLYEMIEREAAKSTPQNPGLILMKMNSLMDTGMCRKLYEASQKGVRIRLCVRGICCLRPGIKGVSDTIEVTSIVGRFLEHSRIFYFRNGGEEEVYLSSADLMSRNLDRRVEIMFPIENEKNKERLVNYLNLVFSDNQGARRLQSDGSYVRLAPASSEPARNLQSLMMETVLERARLEERERIARFQPKGPGAAPGA